TGMLLGMKESYKKGESDSILALSLAAGIARCWPKRRQRYRCRAIELRKADVLGCRLRSGEEEGNTATALSRAVVRSYVV
ncbi:MAG: hypothetical protein ACJ74Z_21515, partial [Bryobacteraceae bacterium]